jgi:non-lysosomal glucosylceramidase
MKQTLLTGLLLCAIAVTAQTVDTSHHVPLNKNLSPQWRSALYSNAREPYRGKDLYTIGMPCGGIGAGQLYVRGDGSLANWWICNNAYNTGYGVESLTHFKTALGPWTVCYKTFRPASYIDQGFAITVTQGNNRQTRALNKDGFDDIAFTGEYPIAKIAYNDAKDDTKKKLPVSVTADVYSPFIPLNARESATPGTILAYTVTNTSQQPTTVSMTGWLQNLVCLDIASDINALSRNRVIKNPGMTSVLMDIVSGPPIPPSPKPILKPFDDFESGYKDWTVTGTAFGSSPAAGSFGGDQDKLLNMGGHGVVNSWLNGDTSTGKMVSREFVIPDDYIVFMIGGGNHEGLTCFNLVVNKKVVCSATGKNTEGLDRGFWDVKKWRGKKAHFEIVDASSGDWGHINLDDIAFSDRAPVKEKYFPALHPYNGNLALSVLTDQGFGDAGYTGLTDTLSTNEFTRPTGQPSTGAVGTTVTIQPGESKTITFLLSWFFPNRPSYYSGSDVTAVIPNNWNTALPTDRTTILGNMYANWFGSSMDVARYLQQNYRRLAGQTHEFHDDYYNQTTLPYWLTNRLLMPLSTLATETCQWWANDKFWAWEGVGSCVGTCTHVWNYEQALAHFFPELERNIRERTDFGTSFQADGGIQARNGWGGVLVDGHAGAILKAYREYLDGHDDLFLTRNWDYIKRATDYLVKADSNADGIIEKVQPNTFDIAFYGANTYVGALYLASLRAAAAMARIMQDTVLGKRYDSIAAVGAANTVKRLWNGEYFIQDVDLREHPNSQYAQGCLSDQLLGQTWAWLDHLGNVYPKDKLHQTLESIWKYNWAPDVATQNRIHPPERTYADFGEPGLLVCTWPRSPHMGDKGVRYRDEVWTGSEYQVATSMIYDNMLDEGLSVVKAINDRYSPAKHNPWNEIECGDHYARAMASWGVMLALEDYYYNGPAKIMGFAPKLQPGHFLGFFTTADAWGNISQERQAGSQVNKIAVTYGTLSLLQLNLTVQTMPAQVTLSRDGNPLPCHFTRVDEGQLLVQFDQLELKPGESLTAKMTWQLR